MRKQFTGLVASFAEWNLAAREMFVDDEKLESRAINYCECKFFYFYFLFDQHLIVITPGRLLTKLDSMIADTSIERRRPGEFSMTGRVRIDHGNEITASTRR